MRKRRQMRPPKKMVQSVVLRAGVTVGGATETGATGMAAMLPKLKAMATWHIARERDREPQPERHAAPVIAIQEIVAQPVEPRKWQPPAATVTAAEAAPKPKAGWWSKRRLNNYGPQTRRI